MIAQLSRHALIVAALAFALLAVVAVVRNLPTSVHLLEGLR